MQSWSCIATIDPSSHLLNQTFLHVCNSSFRFVLHLLPKRHWGEHLQAKTNYGSSPWLFWQETCFEKLSSHNNMKYPLDPMKHTHGKMGKSFSFLLISLMEALLFCFHWCWGDVIIMRTLGPELTQLSSQKWCFEEFSELHISSYCRRTNTISGQALC